MHSLIRYFCSQPIATIDLARIFHLTSLSQNTGRFEGVTRRFENLNPHRIERQALAILEWGKRVVSLRLGAKADGGTHAIPEFKVSGQKVGVKMGQENVANLNVLLRSIMQVLVNVPLRIDNDSGARCRVGDEV